MKTMLRKMFALLLVVAMMTSTLAVAANAEGESAPSGGTEQGAEAGGAGGGGGGGEGGGGQGGGGGMGNASKAVDLSGMLSLKQYVFVKSEKEIKDGTVSTKVYGIYEEGTKSSFETTSFSGDITVYTDEDCTTKADGVTASISGSTLTISGVAENGNVAYYLSTGEDAYVTTIYVVNDEYDENTATLTLADGTTVNLTTYAPNMANGSYTAVEGKNEINGETSIFIGANRTAVSLSDLTDTENYKGYEKAAAWFLQSGITNAGDTLTTFGDKLYVYEYAVGLYREFQIVVDEVTAVNGFADPGDFVGAMMSNDPYSDAVSATVQSGVWNGIFTQKSSTKSEGDSGFYLYENIDGVTNLGTGKVTNIEYAYVGLYNAFQSPWASLNDDGDAMADTLETAAQDATAAQYKDAGTTSSWKWATESIGKASAAAIFKGDTNGNFNAEQSLTRAEFAQVLYNLAGQPAVTKKTNTFKDLTQNWYQDAIEWCYENGIVNGYSATQFGPSDSITREQFAKMLKAYNDLAELGYTAANGSLSKFSDGSKTSSWAKSQLAWAVGNGLFQGDEKGAINPTKSITRAEAATVMGRVADKLSFDYSNSAKITAVSKSVMGETTVPAASTALTKAEAVNVLYAARNYVESKSAPDESLAEKTGASLSDMGQYLVGDYGSPVVVEDGQTVKLGSNNNLVAQAGSALLVKEGGKVTVTNSTISMQNDPTEAENALMAVDENRAADGGKADGHIYNATTRNAYYRIGLGSALTNWGGDVVLTTTNGTLVLDGDAGSMAGTAYVGYGGTLQINNAVAYSTGQHLTNLLYNGTIHYNDSYAIGSGRVYSSDFWGGYQVFEDTIADGGNVTDEPTTLIVKNSVFGNSVGGNGFASQYFENSILNVGTANFQNTTSFVTDTGSLTLVNSVMNSSAKTFASAGKGERAIITVVDSTINLSGNVLATVANHTEVNAITMTTVDADNQAAYEHLYDGEMAIKFYGTVEMNVTALPLTVEVAEGSTLTVYSANLTAADIVNTGKGELKIETGNQYGTVNLIVPATTPSDTTVGSAAGIVVNNGVEVTSKEYTSGVTITGTATERTFQGTLATDSYFATGIALSNSTYTVKNSTFTMGTTAKDNDSIEKDSTPVIGAGAGIEVRNGSTLTVEDTTINTSGAWASMAYPRAGIVAGWASSESGDVIILRNTTITNDGNDENTSNVANFGMGPMNIMKALTVSGKGRALVVLGDTVSYLYNSDISGTGWAAICTDMASSVNGLYVYALGTVGKTTFGGYGIYSDTNCYDYLYGSTLQGADFGAIISNNGVLVLGASKDATKEVLANATAADIATAASKESAIIGGRNAIMTHATSAQATAADLGTITLSDTAISTSKTAKGQTAEQDYMEGFENYLELCDGAAILMRSSSEAITLKNCTVDSYTNTLIQAVVDSDNGGIDADATATASVISLDNVTSKNESMNILNDDFQRGMEVTISNMELKGKLDYMTYADYQKVNYLDGLNTIANTKDAGGLSLTISKDASWTPSEESHLTSLTVNGTLNGTVTVNGEAVTIVAGTTYTGTIVVSPIAE